MRILGEAKGGVGKGWAGVGQMEGPRWEGGVLGLQRGVGKRELGVGCG